MSKRRNIAKIDWNRVSHKHPLAYTGEELLEYMLHFGSLDQEKYEFAARIREELASRRRIFKDKEKVRRNNIRDQGGVDARKRLVSEQLKYLGSFPERPDSRSELLFIEFKMETVDGLAICSVDKIEVRGEFVWYFITQTIMRTTGKVVTRRAQLSSDIVESGGFDYIPFKFNPTKGMSKRYGWLTWNFDIIFDGTAYPQVLTRTDIDSANVKARNEEIERSKKRKTRK